MSDGCVVCGDQPEGAVLGDMYCSVACVDRNLSRELGQLTHRWRSRADLFSEEDDVARRCAEMCADELGEVLDDE